MKKKLAVAAAVVIAVITALLYMRGEGDSTTSSAVDKKEPGANSKRRMPSPPAPAAASRPAVRLPSAQVDDAPSAHSGAIEGRVVNWGNADGVEGAELSFSGPTGVKDICPMPPTSEQVQSKSIPARARSFAVSSSTYLRSSTIGAKWWT
jgi:hypothetical protein